MKRPKPDLADSVRAGYINSLKFLNDFVRHWGTTTVDGVEVLIDRKVFYKNMDASTVRLTKLIGAYDELRKFKHKRVRSAWLWLNPSKKGIENVDFPVMVANFNKSLNAKIANDTAYLYNVIPAGQTQETVINNVNRITKVQLFIGPKVSLASTGFWRGSASKNTVITPPLVGLDLTNQSVAASTLVANYSNLFNDNYTIESSERDRYLDTLIRYILLSNDVSYNITNIRRGLTAINVPYVVYEDTGSYDDSTGTSISAPTVYYSKSSNSQGLIVDIEIPSYVFTETTDIMVAIKNGICSGTFCRNTAETIRRISTPEYDEDGNITGYDSVLIANPAIWYKGKLRKSFLIGEGIPLKDRIEFVLSAIDTDYREKSRSAWERFLSIVIIVGAILLAPYTGGASLKAAAVATYILTVALIITIAAYATSQLGMDGVSLSLTEFLITIEPLTTLAGAVLIIAGLSNLYKAGISALSDAAMDAALTEGVALGEETLRQTVIELVKNAGTSLTNISFAQSMKFADFAFKFYQEDQNAKFEKKFEEERKKITELQETKEAAETRHLWNDFISAYNRPLDRDWSKYASLYDRPYEWWATKYHSGNIQATTVSALWTTRD